MPTVDAVDGVGRAHLGGLVEDDCVESHGWRDELTDGQGTHHEAGLERLNHSMRRCQEFVHGHVLFELLSFVQNDPGGTSNRRGTPAVTAFNHAAGGKPNKVSV
jgi:hypothetical protein